MPTYILTSKSTGKKYKVTGPNREGAVEALKKKLSGEPNDTPEMAARRRQGLSAAPPAFDPGVEGYDPKTGEVHDPMATGAMAKVGAFSTAATDAVPIVGPTLSKVVKGAGAAIVTPFSDQTFSQNYDEMGRISDKVQEDNPGAALAGTVTGTVAPMVALGGTALGARALGVTGNSLGGQVVASGLSNAAINTADTAARGGSLGDSLASGGIGGGIGAAVPVLGRGLSALGTGIKETIGNRLHAIVQPAQAAERAVGRAQAIDAANTGAPILGAADEAAAGVNGQPLLNVDRGGETTRALARSASNTDPEARALIDRTVKDRFKSQADRAGSFIDRISGGQADSLAAQDALQTAAQKVNRPAYKQAYKDGDDLVKTPELERLMGSPAVVSAMKGAITKGKDRAIKEGMGTFNPAVSIADDGRVLFNKTKPGGGTTYPDLQFWDYTKRELDDMAKAAARQGRDSEADTLRGLSQTLRNELDVVVPSYKTARAGAAAFFDAEDALEAGKKFVTLNRGNAETAQALAKMSPVERNLFAVGFASELKAAIKAAPDGTNITRKIFGSPQAREKIQLALGQKNFREFEQFVNVESAMDNLRGAMGNSTTARQLMELGLSTGGVGIGAGIGTFSLTGDWTKTIAATAIAAAARRGGAAVDQRMAKQIAKLLLSNDKNALNRAAKMAAGNPKAAQAVEAIQAVIGTISRGAGIEASRPSHPSITINRNTPALPAPAY